MKRGIGMENSEAPLISRKNRKTTYYVEEDTMYSIHDRSKIYINENWLSVIKYTPNPLNDRIVHFAPAFQFQKDASLLVDFSINNDICVYVRQIDVYMRDSKYGKIIC